MRGARVGPGGGGDRKGLDLDTGGGGGGGADLGRGVVEKQWPPEGLVGRGL